MEKVVQKLKERLGVKLSEVGNIDIQVAIGDLFAVGCYLIKTARDAREKRAGRKICKGALQTIGLKGIAVTKILSKVETDPSKYHELLKPHIECHNLFD